jgi:acid stress-induced BolA-like protein IbaG/YrbA
VDLREKVTRALREHLNPDHIQLEDDDGVSGVVVSAQFRGVSPFDRQMLIDKALRSASEKLTRAELRRVLAIAALTPAEYEGVCQRG